MGKVTVDRKTTFRIELTNTNGETYLGLEEFRMEATEDQKPVVHFVKPGRDYRATNLEEVFTEAKADDDFGVASLEAVLHRQRRQGTEGRVSSRTPAPLQRKSRGTHTFFLEEFKLKPGDFVSYYAAGHGFPQSGQRRQDGSLFHRRPSV